jgi:aconitate hydratase
MQVCSYITDPVTTTDELIPSGETSSYRSNPRKLAEFALSRKDPGYVARAKAAQNLPGEAVLRAAAGLTGRGDPQIGSVIYAVKPGDGSAREQAASCQRVLGGSANIAREYATKRYRSNLINWGMLPFTVSEDPDFAVGDYVLVPDVRRAVSEKAGVISAYIIRSDGGVKPLALTLPAMTDEERQILLEGCLINHYRS